MSHGDVHPDDMPDELDAFLEDLRSAATAAPEPVVGDALATLFRDGTAPMAAPTARRRRVAVRAVVAGAVAGLAFGGLGVAGALPRPVQRTVAEVVDHVGVHLPDARPAPTTTPITVTPPSTTTTTHRATTVPPTVRPTPTTDDHSGRGQGGDDAPDRSGEDHGKADEGHGSSGPGTGGPQDTAEVGSSGKGRSGRTPATGDDVHPEDGSSSGHGNDGGSG